MFIGTAQDVPIDIDSTTLDIDASGAVTVDSTSTISIDGVGNSNFTTDSGTLTISNTTSGDMTVLSAGNIDIDAGGGKISIDGTGGIDIGVESDVAIDVDSSTFDLDASGNITLDSTTGINIGTANSGVAISIGHTTSETTVNDNLTITGNLTVNGETTYVSSSNVTIGDRIIELNYLGATGNGGIYVGDADGTLTSGSLLWDSTNDYWIAGAKDLEHKIMLSNGDSVISGSGTNNQVALFNSTHELDSDGNLTFDGSNLRVTGTQEITENISGSASASFADLKISNDASIASLTVTDLTNDRLVVVGGGGELEDDNNLRWNGTSLAITGNVEASASGSFLNVKVTDTITSDSGSFGRVIGSIGSTNGVVSGSSQVDYSGLSGINNDIVSASTDSDRVNFTINDGNITADLIGGVISGSEQVVLGDIPGFNTYTGSVDTEQSAQNTRLNQLSTETGSIATEQATQDGRLTSLEAETGSIATEQSAQDVRLNQLAAATGSYLTSSGSVAFSDVTDKPGYLVSNLVPGSNVTITSGSGTLTIASTGGGGGGGGVGTLQQVTTSGSVTNVAVEFSNSTDSTSKTTGAVIIGGGLGVNNTINAGGDVIAYASSDERLKDNIKPIENPLEIISQISGNTFDWNSEKQNIYNGKDYGVIAQEIQKVMPELVDTRDNGYLAVKYDKIVPLLIESIKELKKEIEELKSK